MKKIFTSMIMLLALSAATAIAQPWQKVGMLDRDPSPVDFRFCDYRLVYHNGTTRDLFFPFTQVSQVYDTGNKVKAATISSAVNWYEVQFLSPALDSTGQQYGYLRTKMNSTNRPFDFRIHLIIFPGQPPVLSLGYNLYEPNYGEVYGYFPNLIANKFELQRSCRATCTELCASPSPSPSAK